MIENNKVSSIETDIIRMTTSYKFTKRNKFFIELLGGSITSSYRAGNMRHLSDDIYA